MRILIAKNIVHSYLLGTKSARGILSIYLFNKIRREPYLQGFLTESTFQDILKLIEELTDSEIKRDRLTRLIKETLHLLPAPVLPAPEVEGMLSQFRTAESEEIASALRNSLDALVTHDPARYKLATDLLVLTVGEFLDQYRRSKLNRAYLAGSMEAAAHAVPEPLASYNSFRFSLSQILIQHLVQELEAAVHTECYSFASDGKVIFGNESPPSNTQDSQPDESDTLLNASKIYRSQFESTQLSLAGLDSTGNKLDNPDILNRKTPKSSSQFSHPRVTFRQSRYEKVRVELKEHLTLVLVASLLTLGLQYLNQPELVAILKQSDLQEDNLLRFNGLATIPVNSASALLLNQLLQKAKADLFELATLHIGSEIYGEADRSFMQLPVSLVADIAEIVGGFVEDIYREARDQATEIPTTSSNEPSETSAALSESHRWEGRSSIGEAQNQLQNLEHQRTVNSEAERSHLDHSSDKNTLLRDQGAADRFIENGLTRFFQASGSEPSEPEIQSEYAAISGYWNLLDQYYISNSEVNFYDSRNTSYDNLPTSEYGQLPTYDSVTGPSENHFKFGEITPFGPLSFSVMGSGLIDSRSPTSDYVRGQRTNDTLLSGGGNDILNGDRGFDTLTGGRGADTFITGYGVATITDFSAAEGDYLEILGTVEDYNLIQRGSDTVVRVKSQTVARFLDVPVGQVVAVVENTASQDLSFITRTIKDPVIGSAAKDIIGGDMGSYQFFGGNGNDVLIARNGNPIPEFNLLTGGKGADVFDISPHGAGGFSTITDFNSKQGDKIVLWGDPTLYAFDVVGSHTEIRESKLSLFSYQLVAVVQNKQDLNLADISFRSPIVPPA